MLSIDAQQISMVLFVALVYGGIALIIVCFVMLFRSVRRIEKAILEIKDKYVKPEKDA